MRKPKMMGFLHFWLLMITLAGVCNAEGNFEDAETSKDYASSDTYSLFELRHTIPGEPEVDYPIFSKVPKTSFQCTGRHEGYYADMETRCQAFRICAHTARSIRGFSFLCPNGTLFSQRHFVCDWYRNVNCEESEKYYNKNYANRIGNNVDTMMERVRQMMEYPLKTISKALQTTKAKNQQQKSKPSQPTSHTLKKQLELAESGFDVSEVDAVQQSSSNQQGYSTQKQYESGSQHFGYEGHTRTDNSVAEERSKGHEQGADTTNNGVNQGAQNNNGEIYVNSLGELSTDPGVDFVRGNARIIAETTQRKNPKIVEKNLVGLSKHVQVPSNLLVPPVKSVNDLQSNEEFVLASNVNNLLNDVSLDVRSSFSEPSALANSASAFKFLSHGFTSQSDRAKHSAYEYGKPKQTESTIRFSPNELLIDDTYKAGKGSGSKKENLNLITTTNESTTESSDEPIKLTTTLLPLQPAAITSESTTELNVYIPVGSTEPSKVLHTIMDLKATDVSLITNNTSKSTKSNVYYLNNIREEPRSLVDNFLGQPLYEPAKKIETTTADAPTLYEFTNFAGITEASKGQTKLTIDTTTARSPLVFNKSNIKAALLREAIPTPAKVFLPPDTPAPATPAPNEAQTDTSIHPNQDSQTEDHTDTSTHPTIVDENKLDAAHHAARLLLAGVKLTAHNQIGEEKNKKEGSMNVLEQSWGESGSLLIHVPDEDIGNLHNSTGIAMTEKSIVSTTESTTTISATTTTNTQLETTTNDIQSLSDADNFQERIRSYRRFSTQQRSSTNTLSVEKGTHEPEFGKAKTTIRKSASTTTTPIPVNTTTIPATRSYLKRVSANRLRLSRQKAKNSRTDDKSSSDAADASEVSSEPNKNVSVRNIDKEVSTADGGAGNKRPDTRGNSFYNTDASSKRRKSNIDTRANSRNSLRRGQASRRTSTEPTTTVSTEREVTKPTRNVRRRNRFSNLRTSTTAVSTARTSTTEEHSTTATKAMMSSSEEQTNITPQYLPLGLESNTQTTNSDHVLNSITTTPASYSSASSSNLQTNSTSEAQTNASAVTNNVGEKQSDSTFSNQLSSEYITITTTPLDPSVLNSSLPASLSSPSNNTSPYSAPPYFISSAQPSGSSIASSDDASSFIDFTNLSQTLADDSVLQNFRTTKSEASSRSLSENNYASEANSLGSQTIQFNKLPAQDPSQLTPPPRPLYLSQTPTSPSPRIVIAPAVGQRIAPNSFTSVISTLVTQPPPKATPSTAYVPLDDFLTKKFGQTAGIKINGNFNENQQQSNELYTTSNQQQQFYQKQNSKEFVEQQQQLQQIQYKQQQLEQLHQYQLQQQQYREEQTLKQQSFPTHFSNLAAKLSQPPQQYSPNGIFSTPQKLQFPPTFSQQQSEQQTLFTQQQLFSQQKPSQQYAQQSLQNHAYLPAKQEKYQAQQTSPPHIYFPQKQQSLAIASNNLVPNRQQQRSFSTAPQFSLFPPLSNSASFSTQRQPSTSYSIALPQDRDLHLNIRLPTLTTGLIPAPTAQRRSDNLEDDESDITEDQQDTKNRSYSGASSYDVPLNSIGRLPNDITHLLRRLRKVK